MDKRIRIILLVLVSSVLLTGCYWGPPYPYYHDYPYYYGSGYWGHHYWDWDHGYGYGHHDWDWDHGHGGNHHDWDHGGGHERGQGGGHRD
jgi:hypothetical protein